MDFSTNRVWSNLFNQMTMWKINKKQSSGTNSIQGKALKDWPVDKYLMSDEALETINAVPAVIKL